MDISEKDIYRSAQALLETYGNDKDKALTHVMEQFIKYSNEDNEEMLDLTLRIGIALKELTKVSTTVGLLN